ncbi:MAG: phospholipase A [Opitutaceae bacterium]|nr:phospholipase A [Verrucomicrobiales bacterium]
MKAVQSAHAQNQPSIPWQFHRSGLLRVALGIMLSLLFITRAQSGDAVRSWSWPHEPVIAGETISIWLNLLNPGQGTVSDLIPESLTARFEGAEEFLKSTIKLRSAVEAGPVSVAAGAFARREYLLEVPPALRGTVTLTLTGSLSGRFLLQVLPPPIVKTATSTNNLTSKIMQRIKDGETKEFGRTPIEFFKAHMFPYEPIYFLAGPDAPTARFQISLRYQLLNNDGRLAENAPWLRGLSFAYTQTSLWDLSGQSAPFVDSSYMPELLYL